MALKRDLEPAGLLAMYTPQRLSSTDPTWKRADLAEEGIGRAAAGDGGGLGLKRERVRNGRCEKMGESTEKVLFLHQWHVESPRECVTILIVILVIRGSSTSGSSSSNGGEGEVKGGV